MFSASRREKKMCDVWHLTRKGMMSGLISFRSLLFSMVVHVVLTKDVHLFSMRILPFHNNWTSQRSNIVPDSIFHWAFHKRYRFFWFEANATSCSEHHLFRLDWVRRQLGRFDRMFLKMQLQLPLRLFAVELIHSSIVIHGNWISQQSHRARIGVTLFTGWNSMITEQFIGLFTTRVNWIVTIFLISCREKGNWEHRKWRWWRDEKEKDFDLY
jgi:hypothetical protein